jgi:hypothetical protein
MNLVHISKILQNMPVKTKCVSISDILNVTNCNYSKTSLIWERTLVQISESLNYGSATEDMFREVIKWTSHVF